MKKENVAFWVGLTAGIITILNVSFTWYKNAKLKNASTK